MQDVHDLGMFGKLFVDIRMTSLGHENIGSAAIRVEKYFTPTGSLKLEFDMKHETLFTVAFVLFKPGTYVGKVHMNYFMNGPVPTHEKQDDQDWKLGEFCARYPLEYDTADECEDGWQLCDNNGRVIIQIQSVKTAHFLNSLERLTPTPTECVVEVRQVDVGCQTDTPVCSWVARLRDKIWNK